jgi:hypothetical protein
MSGSVPSFKLTWINKHVEFLLNDGRGTQEQHQWHQQVPTYCSVTGAAVVVRLPVALTPEKCTAHPNLTCTSGPDVSWHVYLVPDTAWGIGHSLLCTTVCMLHPPLPSTAIGAGPVCGLATDVASYLESCVPHCSSLCINSLGLVQISLRWSTSHHHHGCLHPPPTCLCVG